MPCPCSAPKKIETQQCDCDNNKQIKPIENCACPKKCVCEGGCECDSCSDDKIDCTCPTSICECNNNCSCGHCKSIEPACSAETKDANGCSC